MNKDLHKAQKHLVQDPKHYDTEICGDLGLTLKIMEALGVDMNYWTMGMSIEIETRGFIKLHLTRLISITELGELGELFKTASAEGKPLPNSDGQVDFTSLSPETVDEKETIPDPDEPYSL